MRKYYFTRLSEKISSAKLYGAERQLPPGLDRERMREVLGRHEDILRKTGSLTDNMDAALASIPLRNAEGGPLYCLAPVNMVLWLYEQGNNEALSRRLFSEIHKRSRALWQLRSEKHKSMRIKFEEMPITANFKQKLLTKNLYDDRKFRKFLHLQALLAILACSVRGVQEEPYDIAHAILSEAAPGAISAIANPLVGGRERNMYSAIFSEKSPLWNVALLRCASAADSVQLIRALIWRGKAAMPRIDSKRTTAISRMDFFLKLLAWLELSLEDDPIVCMDRENMAGACKLW